VTAEMVAPSGGMDLNRFDLNLLLVFEAVLRERSVTRAAERLSLSQPALSHALNRLRYLLKDQLFVRGPSGMEPTPRAEQLSTAVARILEDLRRSLEPSQFDPQTASRRFHIAVSNYAAAVLTAPLVSTCAREAPGISLSIRPSGTLDVADLLDRGELDLAITGSTLPAIRFGAQTIVQDDYVAVMRAGHPALKHPVTAQTFAAWSRLNISSSGENTGFVGAALSKAGLTPASILDAPYLSAANILAGSDHIAVLARRLGLMLQSNFPLVICELPFEAPSVASIMHWSKRMDDDPAHLWLRDRITQVATLPAAPVPETPPLATPSRDAGDAG
jgi:DNA-binding transcriptional LysR family regulator